MCVRERESGEEVCGVVWGVWEEGFDTTEVRECVYVCVDDQGDPVNEVWMILWRLESNRPPQIRRNIQWFDAWLSGRQAGKQEQPRARLSSGG